MSLYCMSSVWEKASPFPDAKYPGANPGCEEDGWCCVANGYIFLICLKTHVNNMHFYAYAIPSSCFNTYTS